MKKVFGQIATSDKEAHLAYVTQALCKNSSMNSCWFWTDLASLWCKTAQKNGAFSTARHLDVSKAPNRKKQEGTQMLRSLNVLILDDSTSRAPGCFGSISIAVPKATVIDHKSVLVVK